MKRRHLLELHEQPWVPQTIRNTFRDALTDMQRIVPLYRGIAPRVVEWLDRVGSDGILDLCSGSGGPALTLAEEAAKVGTRPRLRLSDLFPDLARFEALARRRDLSISFEADPVDATNGVRNEDFRARSIMAAFHHFRPDTARSILADAVRNADGIVVLEPMRRDWVHLVSFLAASTLLPLYPLVGGMTARNLLWCTFVPVVPMMFAFDGSVSVLRAYRPEELLDLTRDPECADFEWQAGHWRAFGPLRGTYLMGVQRRSSSHPSR